MGRSLATFPSTDLLLILLEPDGHLRLGQAEPPADRQEPASEGRGVIDWIALEKSDDPRHMLDTRLGSPQLPRGDRLGADAPTRGEDSLRLTEVEPAAPQVVAERDGEVG
jgi:hypothetical protein